MELVVKLMVKHKYGEAYGDHGCRHGCGCRWVAHWAGWLIRPLDGIPKVSVGRKYEVAITTLLSTYCYLSSYLLEFAMVQYEGTAVPFTNAVDQREYLDVVQNMARY